MINPAPQVEETIPELPPIPKLLGENRKVVTVILDNSAPQIRKNLHCPNCGRIVCNYYSEVRVIIFGEVVEVARPFDVQCSRCKTLVRIA